MREEGLNFGQAPQIEADFAATRRTLGQAQVLGFDNGFVFAGIVLLCGIPLCLPLRPAAHHYRDAESRADSAAESMVD